MISKKIRRTKLCVLISIAVPSYLTQSANYSDSDVNMFYAICIITKKAVTLEKSRVTAFFPVKLATGIGPVTSALPMRRTTDCATAASFCFRLISKPRLVYHDTIVLSTVFLNFFYFFKFPVFFIGCLRFHSQTSDSHFLSFHIFI